MPEIQQPENTQPDPNAASALQSRIARLERQVAAFRALQEVARSLISELNLDQLLSRILQTAVAVMQGSAGSLMLLDPATNELVFRVVQGGSGDALLQERFPSDQGIAGAVFTSGQPSIVHDVTLDSRFLRLGDGTGFSATSLIAVPLVHKGTPIGVLEVLNKKSGERFNADDEELLLAFAAQSAVAIENARLFQQVVAERDRILAVEDQVRRELARDLHDGPSQLLAAIIMNLRFLRLAFTRKPDNVRDEITSLEQLSLQALQQVRNLLFDLRPVVLETQGLRAALGVYVDRQRETQDLEIHLDVDPLTMRFGPRAEAAIFSIVQEAVGNVRKHAAAQNVWIKARQRDANLEITIQDDGRGFDVSNVEEAVPQRGNMGLLNMRERAEIAHGRLTVDSEPGKGTLVTVQVPLTECTHEP